MKKYKLKKLIKRIDELLDKVNSLPDTLVNSSDLGRFYDKIDESEKEKIYSKTASIYEEAQSIKRDVRAFIDTYFGECEYKEVVSQLTFRHKTLRANFGNYLDDEAFNEDKHILTNVLLQMKADFENGKEINSSKSIFENSLFWIIIVPITGLAFFIGGLENKYSNNYQTDKYKKLYSSYQDSLTQKKDSINLLININDSISLINKDLHSQVENIELNSKISSELSTQLSDIRLSSFYTEDEFGEWEERTIIILEKWKDNQLKEYYIKKLEATKKYYYIKEDYKKNAENTLEKILLMIK
ncbi:hypothetical protein MM239_11350 [Belliella sp. DSM 111904]|uniref:Uncharacterized protein n=1 Tax=Belliella filtrata TaxID=2923435 RepID=A0ABS9V0P6_9BACT|nr:hypothetical protein [Belliella filtrata]MCH7409991.1 hypothetical protein [Belliella filtrata]